VPLSSRERTCPRCARERLYAEGLAISDASKQASLAKAANAIEHLNALDRLAA
jgi:hypothetical protein